MRIEDQYKFLAAEEDELDDDSEDEDFDESDGDDDY